MSWVSRLRHVFRAGRVSDEIDREIRFHLAEREDELIASGMTPETARREARRRFGNVAVHREATRDRDLLGWLDTTIADARYAARVLRAAPAFTAVAVLSLALGIGANTAIFTVIQEVMIRTLPVGEPDALVMLTRTGPTERRSNSFPADTWEDLAGRETDLVQLAAYGSGGANLDRGGEARPAAAGFVSGEFFRMLRARPAAGRLLGPGDDRPGCPAVAVITSAFWRSEYGAHPDLSTMPLSLNGQPFAIVGVAEPSFIGIEIGYRPAIWVPLCAERIVRGAAGGGYRGTMGRMIIGRLAPDAALAQLNARVPALAQTRADPADADRGTTFVFVPFAKGIRDLSRAYGDALLALMAVAAIVLLIACANVASLLLARATARQREIAVRLTLGAGRGRIARQLLTESLMLSAAGAAAGVLFAVWGSRAFVQLLTPPGRTVGLDLSLNPDVLAFTIGTSALTGVLFGLAPAWRAARVDPQAALRAGGRGALGGHTRFHTGKALVAAQVALSLASVTAATLLVGSWQRLAAVEPGFRGDHVVLASADLTIAHVAEERQAETYTHILERLRAIPGVAAASGSHRTPFDNVSWTTAIAVDGHAAGDLPVVQLNEITEGYFAAIGVPIVAGRDFTAADTTGSVRVAIVSEALARVMPGAIGTRVRWDHGPGGPLEIVGIAGDTRMRSLRESAPPIVYLASRQNPRPGPGLTFAIRSAGSAAPIADVKAAIASVNPRISLRLSTLEQQRDDSLHLPRAMGLLSGVFGACALGLAALGLYGIAAYGVSRRRGEIGVRIALGAPRRRIVRMVFDDIGRLVVIGIAIGVPLCLLVTRLVTSLLYGVASGDLRAVALSIAILASVTIGAALGPASRAARVDPIAALRED